MDDNPTSDVDKTSLFAHPLTFLVTHALFPLLTLGAVCYLYWVSCDGLEGAARVKAVFSVGFAAFLPLAAAATLCFRPKRMNATLLFLWAFVGAAYLYLGVPVASEMVRKVDDWVFGPTPFFLLFAGIVPLVFAGIARVATARWKWTGSGDLGVSFACLFGPPVGLFCFAHFIASLFSHSIGRNVKTNPLLDAVLAHLGAILFFGMTAVFFIGLLRLLHKFHAKLVSTASPESSRLSGALFCGLLLPCAGLALNRAIPFPADFQNAWAWGLAVLTGLILMLPVPKSAWGLAAYFARFVVAPFVLYFFLLFLPFLPLAIPAILAMGAGFLILAPTLLFRAWTRDAYAAHRTLRTVYSRRLLVTVAIVGFLVLPAGFAFVTEMERYDLERLIAWQTKEEFDELEPPPLPMTPERAQFVMNGVNDYTFGAETPFLSAWRTFRVCGGMYMADKLRNDLNKRILGKTVDDERDWETRRRNLFGAGLFGVNSARRSSNRGGSSRWVTRPPRTTAYSASAAHIGTNENDAVCEVIVNAQSAPVDSELVLDFRVPAGTWVEGMSLKMTNDVWKTARATERKAAEWVYNKITEQRRDPSIVTMDTPTTGRLKVFPVGEKGREVKLRLRRPAALSSARSEDAELIAFAAVPRQHPARRVFNKKTHRYDLIVPPPVPNLPWQVVSLPRLPGREPFEAGDVVCCAQTHVSVVSADWFAKHASNAAPSVIGCDALELDVDDPALMSLLRRRVRFAATHMADGALGVLPSFSFAKTVDGTNRIVTAGLPKGTLSESELAVLRRELPGLEVFGDRPVDGWFAMDTAEGGKVAVPYRKGESAIVFEALKGARTAELAWSAGAAAWRRERESFLHPSVDARRDLLAKAHEGAALTTQTSFIVVETAAQEKGLVQKELEALHGDKAMEFDESSATSGDAPGFLLLALGLLVFAALSMRQGKAEST